MSERLYRSNENAILGGVCQGLGDYFRLDAIWVRIYFFLFFLAGGLGFFLYALLWILLPRKDKLGAAGTSSLPQPDEFADRFRLIGEELRQLLSTRNPLFWTYLGVGMIVLGAISLLELLPNNWWDAFKTMILWPALLIVAGVVILLRATRGEK